MKLNLRGKRSAQLGILFRAGVIERAEDDDDGRVIEFSFSSETPYERYFGVEVLGHKRTEVALERLNDSGAYLKDHDPRQQIGVVEKAWIDTAARAGRVRARFGKTALAEEERVEVHDKIRTKVSVGYLVHEMRLEKTSDEGPDEYRVTKWEPIEVSNVAIPADVTVGHGREYLEQFGLEARADEFATHTTRIIDARSKGDTVKINTIRKLDGVGIWIEEKDLDTELHERIPETKAAAAPTPAEPKVPAQSAARTTEPNFSREDAEKMADERIERSRKNDREIRSLGTKYHATDKADKALAEGKTSDEFRLQLFDEGHTAVAGSAAGAGSRDYPSIDGVPTDLGLTKADRKKYSILRAAYSMVDGDREAAAFERECSREIEKRLGRKARPGAFFVPRDVLGASVISDGQRSTAQRLEQILRELTVAGSGGSLVETDLLAGSFIDLLRNMSAVGRMGATMLPGLVGDITLPRQATGSVGEWLAESGAVTDSDLTLDLVTLSPKTIGRKTQVTRRMQMQSTPAVEGLVRLDLASAVALGVDFGALNGTGANDQPTGIRNMAGVAVVSLGTPDGGAATWASQVSMVKNVRAANALTGRLGWLMPANAWAHLMVTPREAGYPTYLLPSDSQSHLGHPYLVSEQVPSNLVEGGSGATLSSQIFGDFSSLLIGEWGVMEIKPDPYTAGDQDALILRVFQDVDVAARHEESFSIIEDMDTTGV